MIEKLILLLGEKIIGAVIRAVSSYFKRKKIERQVIKRVKQISKESVNDQVAASRMSDLLNI